MYVYVHLIPVWTNQTFNPFFVLWNSIDTLET